MPRKRNPENAGLPARWRYIHEAYYYQVPVGLEAFWGGKKTYRLGKTLPDAYREWSERIDANDRTNTIGQLLDRYLIQVVPKKANTTQEANVLYIKQLRAVFGNMPIGSIIPQDVYKYVEYRSKKKQTESGRMTGGVTTAHREIEVLSHTFTKAVQWGLINKHPFKGEIRLEGERPRDRYIEDWEIIECLSLDSKRTKGSVHVIQAYIRIKLMTGMAKSDLLRLKLSDIADDGIRIQRHKTRNTSGKRTHYEMTDDLKRAIELAKAARPVLSQYLFCNRKGQCYIDDKTDKSHGWDSMWGRFLDRVMTETKVADRFTEHDLRAKCASDAATLEQARALLSHADARTTEAIYRRKPERVQPLKGVK